MAIEPCERFFSKLSTIKTKSRNRLLDLTLRTLLNGIHGPEQGSDKEVFEIAEKWMKSKDLRTSLPCNKLSATDTDENMMDIECCGINDELGMNVFWT